MQSRCEAAPRLPLLSLLPKPVLMQSRCEAAPRLPKGEAADIRVVLMQSRCEAAPRLMNRTGDTNRRTDAEPL